MTDVLEKLKPLDPEAYTQAVGHVVWLMTRSADHRDLPISAIEDRVFAPLALKQVRLFMSDKQPLGAVIWAYASPELAARVTGGDLTLTLNDWRSGPDVCVVDCIAPFGNRDGFINKFLADVATAQEQIAAGKGATQ